MNNNTYKSQRKPSFFTYMEHTIRLKRTSFYGLPGSFIPRLLFLFFMGIFYVGNTHYYEKMVRKIGVLEREVDTLRVDYTTLQADYAVDCKQSEVAKKVTPCGFMKCPIHP